MGMLQSGRKASRGIRKKTNLETKSSLQPRARVVFDEYVVNWSWSGGAILPWVWKKESLLLEYVQKSMRVGFQILKKLPSWTSNLFGDNETYGNIKNCQMFIHEI